MTPRQSTEAAFCTQQIEAVDALRQNLLKISQQQKPKVLIVDDNNFDSNILKQQIGEQCVPMDVEITNRCEDALPMIRGGKFDLVFVDLKFPTMSGVDLLREVGAETERAKFIAMSGLEDAADAMQQALKNGASAIFRKPFSDDQMRGICGMVAA